VANMVDIVPVRKVKPPWPVWIGQKVGTVLILERDEERSRRRTYVKCRCLRKTGKTQCLREWTTRLDLVLREHGVSCGHHGISLECKKCGCQLSRHRKPSYRGALCRRCWVERCRDRKAQRSAQEIVDDQEYLFEYNMKHQIRMMLQQAKRRAIKVGVPFDLDQNDVSIPNACPLLGIPIRKRRGHVTAHSPSLDRIVPHLGYVKGNVWVISWRANRLKGNASIEELEMLSTNLRLKISSSQSTGK